MPPTPPDARKLTYARRSVAKNLSSDETTPRRRSPYETNTVQDRIRQWQAQGAAVAPAPDCVSVLSAPQSDICTPVTRARSPRPSGKEAEDIGAVPHLDPQGRSSGRWVDVDQREWVRKGRASTPRKRVVSDDRWKLDRDLRQPATAPTKEKKPLEKAFLEAILPNQDVDRTISKARAEREERRRRRKEARVNKARTPRTVTDDDVTERDIPQSSRGSPPTTSFSSAIVHAESYAETIRMEMSDEANNDYTEVPYDHDHYEASEDGEQSKQRSRYVQTLGQPPQYAQDTPLRSRKGSIMTKTKEILGMSEQPRVMPNRLPSIEAWLEDQPDDPFVTTGSPPVPTANETSAFKKRRSHKQTSSRNVSVADPNKIWESISVAEMDGDSVDQNLLPTNVLHPQQNEDVESSSPTSLRRHGARSSRPKRHTVSQTLMFADAARCNSSDDTQRTASLPVAHSRNRICPQTGSTPLSTVMSMEALQLSTQQVFKPSLPLSHEDPPQTGICNLKRKLTTHEDLMSELSRPKSSRSLRKARSVRVFNRQRDEQLIQRVLDNMKIDETKYNRELRTLVDGVIPVLLQSVLSKNDSMTAASLFTASSSTEDGVDFAKSIVDMGIALERLKSLHNRIPFHSVESLLSWCQTAHKAYSDYLKAWRLGFQDIIVNLAPLNNSREDNSDIMERDSSGDVIDAHGEKADVAYLLKRPLVKLRKIGKDLSCLRDELQDNPVAAKIAQDYIELTAQAKKKHSQEQGRLEDEDAANVDATKVRDLRTMAPLSQVKVDKHRKVRARDEFDMELHHASGQRMNCRVEMILRDDQPGLVVGGDLLICGLDESGAKWLMFAPVDTRFISARKGQSGHDLVVMVRGHADLRSEWHELLALKAEGPETAAEWMNMLGSNPLPPKLNRAPTFLEIKAAETMSYTNNLSNLNGSVISRVPSLEELDIPIGEPSIIGAAESHQKQSLTPKHKPRTVQPSTKLSLGGGLQQKAVPDHWQARDPTLHRKLASSIQSSERSAVSGYSELSMPTSASKSEVSSSQSIVSQHRGTGSYQSREQFFVPQVESQFLPEKSQSHSAKIKKSNKADEVLSSGQAHQSRPYKHEDEPVVPRQSTNTESLQHHHVVSAAPSEDLPSMPKLRESSETGSASSTPLTDTIRERWSALSSKGKKLGLLASSPIEKPRPVSVGSIVDTVSSPIKQSNRHSTSSMSSPGNDKAMIEKSVHTDMVILGPRTDGIPPLQNLEYGSKQSRLKSPSRSSPLKHEYAPSMSSATADEYDSEYSSDTSSSDTSDDLGSELKDEAKSLPDMALRTRKSSRPLSMPQSAPTTGTRTLAPSDSASQGPYRRALPASAFPADSKKHALAMVCSWSDTAMWQPLQEDECAIIVSPGLVEVFPASSSRTSILDNFGKQPLVAFELTPLVQLRQGTAVDITIRSPPTANSQIRTSNNTMFRSRTIADSDKLYGYINWARCNNLTYMELERSRPRPQPAVTFSNQQSERPKSWFSFGSAPRRQNSYRAGSMPPASMQESTASSGTVSNALSALKRLSRNSAFSINRSSVIRRPGLAATGSLYSSSAETTTISGSGSSTPAPATQLGHIPGKEGPSVPETSAAAVDGAGMINNMKIKFFVRTGQDWRPMGWGRLSVLPAPVRSPSTSRPGSSSSTPPTTITPSRRNSGIVIGQPGQRREYRLPSSSHTPHRIHGNGREKRIVVTKNKKPDTVFLDEILGESCFEKIAERGIAIKVWKEEEQIAHRGGVMTGRGTMYMLQFDSASEASWVFGLCGTYRYGFQEGN